MSETHRVKIQNSNVLNALIEHAEGPMRTRCVVLIVPHAYERPGSEMISISCSPEGVSVLHIPFSCWLAASLNQLV
jgi:hypothetical protein